MFRLHGFGAQNRKYPKYKIQIFYDHCAKGSTGTGLLSLGAW